jgi:curved DNA-binding protein CbpA
MARNGGRIITKDFYSILQVSRTATTDEIKIAYRKLALAFHPDRHDGDASKTLAFKEASEAYTILVDSERRRQYDIAHGLSPSGWYNKNRKRPPPSNYRKVYAPHAPPDGKWHDAQRHYDMHYGDGMFQDAIKNAYERAKASGEFEYRSPLGKAFVFESAHAANGKKLSEDWNPYSKASQGPLSQEYTYEEGYVSEAKTVMKRKAGIVNKLHERRQERYELDEQHKAERRSTVIIPGQKVYEPLNRQPMPPTSDDAGIVGCAVM